MQKLVLILNDQLNLKISSLQNIDRKNDAILLCEVFDKKHPVKHHKKKIIFLLSAMRHFAKTLRDNGFTVHTVALDDKKNTHSLTEEVKRFIQQNQPKSIVVTEPSEWWILEEIKQWQKNLKISVEIRQDDRFYCSHEKFIEYAKGKKSLCMENFYEKMRREHNILMKNGKPIGGKWNYDKANRKPLAKDIDIPKPTVFKADKVVKEVTELVSKIFGDHFGDIEPFYFALTEKQAQKVLQTFIDERLPDFGDYQDAMAQDQPWLFHSHISFYLNCGLLLPQEAIKMAENAYHDGKAPLNAVEGFIRQILGWREFIRGIYWLRMPSYAEENFFNHKQSLPKFYWTGETDMNCLAQCIKDTKENAYAHHIQRLMVIGNFSLLAGLDPVLVQEWYLIVYADAFEWVEMPNVVGMILHADGGFLASKPYIASGNYINKMSNYCEHCSFSVKEKTGNTACPFNYLYWNFLDKHQEKLGNNRRLTFPYATLSKMQKAKLERIRKSAKQFLESIEYD